MLTRIATTASAMVMLLSVQAGAAAPQLPPNAVGPQTTVVSYMDGSTFTPDAMRQAARAVLGPNSPSLAQLNQQIAKYQERYDKATQAGVQSLMVIANTSAPQKNPAGANAAAPPQGMKEQAATWVQLKPGADSAAVEKMIREEMKPEDQDKAVFERQGNFLVMHQKDQKLPANADAARAKQFADALSHANAAVVVAFIPDQAMRDQAKKEQNNANSPKWIQDAMPVLSNSQWGTLAVNLGQAPAITVTVQTADDQSAKTLSASINAGLAQLRQLAQNPNQGAGAGGPMAMIAPMLAPLADALRPNQQGSTVMVQLNGPALSMIAETAAHLAPVFMGGNGQGH